MLEDVGKVSSALQCVVLRPPAAVVVVVVVLVVAAATAATAASVPPGVEPDTEAAMVAVAVVALGGRGTGLEGFSVLEPSHLKAAFMVGWRCSGYLEEGMEYCVVGSRETLSVGRQRKDGPVETLQSRKVEACWEETNEAMWVALIVGAQASGGVGLANSRRARQRDTRLFVSCARAKGARVSKAMSTKCLLIGRANSVKMKHKTKEKRVKKGKLTRMERGGKREEGGKR